MISKLRLITLFLLISQTLTFSQAGRVRQVKLTDFELQSSAVVTSSGEEISAPGYKSKDYWFPVKVPSTVLSGLVANGVYPDPNMGLNNMLIPDASDEFNRKYDLEKFSFIPGEANPWKKPYWYRTEFQVPASDAGRCFQLIFKGINYRAGVWVNGSQVADSTVMAGMFAQYSLDVTRHIRAGELNAIAVKIYPLDYPGLPSAEQLKTFDDFYPNGGPTGDIGKNVTMLCSVGWDWVPPVRDRNMGIWLPVCLRTTGGVTIGNTKITTSFAGEQDTSVAKISLGLTLFNHTGSDEMGKLTVKISPENFRGTMVEFSRNVTVGGNGSNAVELTPDNTKELTFHKPAVWWPNGYGKPNLYRINLSYTGQSGISDDTTFLFGVRTVSSKAIETDGNWRRDFYVNGRRVHLTGGAWVPDFMLNRDSLRYDYELRLCRNANINLVRIWGGGVTPRDEFFDAADRYGLLVWSDFWITGDTQGEFKGSPDWPFESEVFKRNVESTILRIRNHPSLLVWTGGNEGHARRELYDFMRNSIISLDGTRPFIPSSSGFARLPEGWPASWPDNNPGGVYSGGPYTWQDPVSSYKRAVSAKDWVFKDETGLPSMQPYNILPRIIPDLVWDKTLPYPLNNTWGYHDACTGNGRWDTYYRDMIKRHGEPESMEQFCDKMQLMNAVGYQGIFEAAGHKLNDIGGVMLWKLNAAFPSLVWQVYDWYMMPNAGYYFMQNACEPVHIQLNLLNNMVMVLNRTYRPIAGLTAQAEVWSLDSKRLFTDNISVSLGATDIKETSSLDNVVKGNRGLVFVVLNLRDKSGNVVSRNVYWISSSGDYKVLDDMAKTNVETTVLKTENGLNDHTWKIRVRNNSAKIAFFLRPQILMNEEEILPSFWSQGYFTLAPGEKTEVTVTCPETKLTGGAPVLKVSGWNVPAVYTGLVVKK
ncbi:MAG: sugar-binding domain-containing protein [Bacteroidales bacterium]